MNIVKNIISIHGAPRSGTSWLGQIFNSSPDVAYRFQPFFSFAFKNRIGLDSDKKCMDEFFNDLMVTNDDFVLQKTDIDGKEAIGFSKNEYPSHLVIKEVRYHYMMEHLLEQSEKVKMIGIIRHPCAVINSWYRAPREFNSEWKLEDEWLKAPLKNLSKLEEYNGFEKWVELAQLFLLLEKKFPQRFNIVKYDNLVANTITEVERLFHFSGLELRDQTLKFISDSKNSDGKGHYSVFKSNAGKEHWKAQLDPKIAEEIQDRTKSYGLQTFLE